MNRLLLVKIHTILAGFFFTTALLFLLTGGLMNLGVKGDYEKTSEVLQLGQSLPDDINSLKAIIGGELSKRGIAPPKGKADLETQDNELSFEWEGSQHTVLLKGDIDTSQATLTIETADKFRFLVNLHKSEGSNSFKVLAVAWSLGLLALLISGLLMAWQAPKYKTLSLQAMGAGVVAFIIAAYFS
ncbi:hypothetical protein [Oceanicoccus sp. KOV_DT_Chl]|uniref:hypothetical protein n=1 Tax=Oceanicoccus sp. KOV_DT_Chl TaxID=1904639 RepID=UPI000C7B566E|nr:hypothetical protein [Oceanicoccus sp. KOV_DT_Chl]